tara:strand:- start:24862 stop:25098 length:237 start_codon:yes stop_codon:yes gene_type:complete
MIDENEMVGLNALSDNTKHISELVAYVLDMTDLNTCDECGVVQYSDDLNWWECMNKKDQLYWSQHKNGDALCNDCWRD